MKRKTSGFLRGTLPILFCICGFVNLGAQPSTSCQIGVSVEPRATSITLRPNKISQTKYSYLTKWLLPHLAAESDDQKSSVLLSSFKHSTHLLLSDFGANIPAGATVQGIEVWLEGQSTKYTSISEMSVTLLANQSSIISVNKAGTAHLQKPWSSKPDLSDKSWCYGSKIDTWGVKWDADEINAKDFTLEIQLRNATSQEVTAYLDDVKVIIHYMPLFTICSDTCAMFHVDFLQQGYGYQWHLPANFKALSHENYRTINIMGSNATYGTYTICVDILDIDGLIAETCCRKFNYQECKLNSITGVAFDDQNQNNQKDPSDPLLREVTIFLKNPQGQEIQTATTDQNGMYIFDQIISGNYYLEVNRPSGKLFVLKDLLIPAEVNSDFSNAFGPGTTNLLMVSNGMALNNIDFGFIQAAQIGDLVWNDSNYNGLQDPGEPGIAQVKVQLLDENQMVVAETTTDANGNYVFMDLVPGNYALYFFIPNNSFATCQQAAPESNSNINNVGKTDFFQLTSGAMIDSIDAGFVQFGSLSGIAFEDVKVDGIYQETDTPLPGISVVLKGLTKCGENVSDSMVTGLLGVYHFSNLKPGTYELDFGFSSENIPTRISGLQPLSNKMSAQKNIAGIIVNSGQDVTEQHAGVYRLGGISGNIWNDNNANSFFDLDENGLVGASLLLNGTDAFGNVVDAMTISNGAGRYFFNDLIPGTYQLFFQVDPKYGFSPKLINADTTRDNNSDGGSILGLDLCSGLSFSHLGIAVFEFSTVGDFVWEDLNGNGIFESNEPGLPDIDMSLVGTDRFGNAVSLSEVTNANGLYRFQGLSPGTYRINLSNIGDFVPTLFQIGNDETLDSDADDTGQIQDFELKTGENNLTLDAGLYQPGSVQGMVWEDLNCDGSFGFIDQRVENIEIVLEGTTAGGAVVQKTVFTASDGSYGFFNLDPGTYQVSMVLSNGYITTNHLIQGLNIISGTSLQQVDFSVYRLTSLGDFIWLDTNENGLQDPDEPGLDSVVVNLNGIAGGINVSKSTISIGGFYSFNDLKPGEYTLQFISLEDMEPTLNQGGIPDLDSDIQPDGTTFTLVLFSGNNFTDIDAGFVLRPKGEVGDFVWVDLNGNGIQDTLEPGLAGVSVLLSGMDQQGNTIMLTTQTDESGYYNFPGIKSGSYALQFELSVGYVFTKVNNGNGENDSKADPTTGSTISFFLASGEVQKTMDAGVFKLSSLGDFVWFDVNENGAQDAGEPGIGDVEISLFDETGPTLIHSVFTDSLGKYSINGIVPGTYFLTAAIPADKLVTLPSAAQNDIDSDFYVDNSVIRTNDLMILSGVENEEIDAGFIEKRTEISGYLWRDNDADGILEEEESRFASFLVILQDENGNTLATTMTDSLGYYYFGNLTTALYRVFMPLVEGFTFTRWNQSTDPEIDSDVLDLAGGTILVNLTEGDRKKGINAGYVTKSSIGDYVWLDLNENGYQDVNEVGINGIKVYLFNLSNVLLDSVTTSIKPGNGISGYYVFPDLLPGDYYLRFKLPNNLLFSTSFDSLTEINSDVTGRFGEGTTDTLTLDFQEKRFDIDAGMFLDENKVGEINGVVWQDENANGTREGDDLLLDGVEVKLHDLNGTEIDIVFTDAQGKYQFDNVYFGSYYLSIPDVINRVFVLYMGANSNVDSEITNEFGPGTSRIISLFPGDILQNIDLGYAPEISLGDLVWEDSNFNGFQDAGEPGVPGIVIHLLDKFGVVVALDTTDINGHYTFENLAAGTYSLKAMVNGEYIFTKPLTGPDHLNSKADLTGLIPNTDFLLEGSYLINDFGLIRPGTIGDRVWLDLNGNGIFSQNEPGIQDVLVELFTADGSFVKSTRTGPQGGGEFVGLYQFKHVRPGDYYIRFNIPSTYLLSPSMMGGPDIDSDITGAFGYGTTNLFSIAAGEDKNHMDAGAYLPACIGDRVWNDENQNGNQDEGEPGIAGIKVSLFLSSGALLDTVTTDSAGNYKFFNLRSRLYYIQFARVEGFQFTMAFQGNSSSTDSDVDETGTTPLISLAHGSIFLDVDAGMFATSNKIVTGVVWDDLDKNGLKDDLEPFIVQAEIHLLNQNGEIIKSVKSNHRGVYAHVMQLPAIHYIQVEEKESYLTSQRATHTQMICNDMNANGMSDPIWFESSPPIQSKNGAMHYQPTTSIKGSVWKDDDGNLQHDEAGDVKLTNVVILLFNQNNEFVKSTKTDEGGHYLLEKLLPGNYYVKIPTFEGLDFILKSESPDSEVTNELGLGTSGRILVDINHPANDFKLGYQEVPDFKEQPEGGHVKTDFFLYPNPTMYNIKIQLPGPEYNSKFRISNSVGQIFKSGVLTTELSEIDMTDVPQGMYTIEIQIGSQVKRQTFFRMENY